MRRAYVFGHAFFAPRKAWQSGGRLMAGNLRGMFTEAGDVMMVTWREILFFLILFGANLIQAITGFAGTLLAMPPSMQLLGVDEAKSVLAVLDQLSCLLIVLTGFRHINWHGNSAAFEGIVDSLAQNCIIMIKQFRQEPDIEKIF